MPLTPKDEIGESSTASESAPADLTERLSDVEALVSEHDSTTGELRAASEDRAAEVEALRERVIDQQEQIKNQREAIAELAEAFESLSGIVGEQTGSVVALDEKSLGGIYDPTREFE